MNENTISKIDTSRRIVPTVANCLNEIRILQEKINEIVDIINIQMLPDEDYVDEDDEPVVVSPSSITNSSKKKS